MTIGVSIVHFVIKVSKSVQMIVAIYRVQASYQVPIVNRRWPPKIKDGRHKIKFFDISTSDGNDMDVKEDQYLCFIDYSKAFDRVHNNQLIECLQKNRVRWKRYKLDCFIVLEPKSSNSD